MEGTRAVRGGLALRLRRDRLRGEPAQLAPVGARIAELLAHVHAREPTKERVRLALTLQPQDLEHKKTVLPVRSVGRCGVHHNTVYYLRICAFEVFSI